MTTKDAAASDPSTRSTRQSPAQDTQANTLPSTTPSTTTGRTDPARTTPQESVTPAQRQVIANQEREKLLREQGASKRPQPTKAVPTDLRAKFEALQAERDGKPKQSDDDAGEQKNTHAAEAHTESNLTRAKEALRRSGLWTSDEIEAMSRDDVLRKGRRLARQTSARATASQTPQTPTRSAQTPAQAGAPGTQATGQPATSGPQQALPAAVSELVRRFEAAGQRELGEAVGAFLTTVSPHATQQGALTPQGGQPGVTDAQIVQELRGELSERFPDLANDDDFEELGEVANQLMQTRPFAIPATASPAERKAMFARAAEHAAAMLEFEDIGGGSPAANTRRAGRATMPNSTRVAPNAADPKAVARAVFEGIQAGLSPETARRRAGIG